MFKSENASENILGVLLVVAGACLRLVPHPWNWAPVTAIALFSGVALSPRISWFLPLLVMMASDLFLGAHPLMLIVWAAFLAVSFLGIYLRKDPTPLRIFYGTLAGSFFFFIVTNLAVFVFQDMYAKNFSGFIQCYVMALPFFRNTLLGDLFYTGVLFGAFSLGKIFIHSFARPKALR